MLRFSACALLQVMCAHPTLPVQDQVSSSALLLPATPCNCVGVCVCMQALPGAPPDMWFQLLQDILVRLEDDQSYEYRYEAQADQPLLAETHALKLVPACVSTATAARGCTYCTAAAAAAAAGCRRADPAAVGGHPRTGGSSAAIDDDAAGQPGSCARSQG